MVIFVFFFPNMTHHNLGIKVGGAIVPGRINFFFALAAIAFFKVNFFWKGFLFISPGGVIFLFLPVQENSYWGKFLVGH